MRTLEHSRDTANATSVQPSTVRLERPRYLVVLFRAENAHIMKIRLASEECSLDTGGLPFLWLTGAKPAESVALLQSFVTGEDFASRDSERTSQAALTAIAMHADSAADRALESFVQPSQPASLRKQAAFWLGAARGASGFHVLQTMARSDASPDVRAHVAFALSSAMSPKRSRK